MIQGRLLMKFACCAWAAVFQDRFFIFSARRSIVLRGAARASRTLRHLSTFRSCPYPEVLMGRLWSGPLSLFEGA